MCHIAKTGVVDEMVMTGNSHQLCPTEMEVLPFGRVDVSKNILKRAWVKGTRRREQGHERCH
jgi:hypothetical protein